MVFFFIWLWGPLKALTDLWLFWKKNKLQRWLEAHGMDGWYQGGNDVYPPGRTYAPFWIIALIFKKPETAKMGADYWHTFDDWKMYDLCCAVIAQHYFPVSWTIFAIGILPAIFLAQRTFTLLSHYLLRDDPDGPLSDWVYDFFYGALFFWRRDPHLKTFTPQKEAV